VARKDRDEAIPEPPTAPPPGEPGSIEHYLDAALYDHEYRHRRRDVHHYVRLAEEKLGGSPRGCGGWVVELGCGSGRVLVPLAKAGHSVIGVDRSRPMLLRAVERLARLPRRGTVPPLLLQGDLRALPLASPAGSQERVPLVIAAFHTLQHLYTRRDFERFFTDVRAVLSDGGWLAFDVLNPDLDWLVRDPRRRWSRTRFTHPVTGDQWLYSTNHFYDAATQLAHIHLYYAPRGNGPLGCRAGAVGPPGAAAASERVVRLTHRQLFPEELLALVHHHGFSLVHRWGGFDQQPFTDEAESQVLVVAKR
jgi:SAM-dependent methyltransferase